MILFPRAVWERGNIDEYVDVNDPGTYPIVGAFPRTWESGKALLDEPTLPNFAEFSGNTGEAVLSGLFLRELYGLSASGWEIALKKNRKGITAENPVSGKTDDVLTIEKQTENSLASKSVNPKNIRFSQRSVNNVDEIADSMRAQGWKGDAIDVVRMPDGKLTTLDNTRVLAADRAGINVNARIHNYDDALPSNFVDRFTIKKGGAPSTFGDAVTNRIGTQGAAYRNTYPSGSRITGVR